MTVSTPTVGVRGVVWSTTCIVLVPDCPRSDPKTQVGASQRSRSVRTVGPGHVLTSMSPRGRWSGTNRMSHPHPKPIPEGHTRRNPEVGHCFWNWGYQRTRPEDYGGGTHLEGPTATLLEMEVLSFSGQSLQRPSRRRGPATTVLVSLQIKIWKHSGCDQCTYRGSGEVQ